MDYITSLIVQAVADDWHFGDDCNLKYKLITYSRKSMDRKVCNMGSNARIYLRIDFLA